jgi:hypothetical protein
MVLLNHLLEGQRATVLQLSGATDYSGGSKGPRTGSARRLNVWVSLGRFMLEAASF